MTVPFSAKVWLRRVTGEHRVRFLCGSAICAGINNVILIVGDYLGFGYVLLTILYYFVSSSVGYLWHTKVTFSEAMSFKAYSRFLIGIYVGLPVSIVLLWLMTDILLLPMWFAAPVVIALMLLFNYRVTRLAIPAQTANRISEAPLAH